MSSDDEMQGTQQKESKYRKNNFAHCHQVKQIPHNDKIKIFV